MKLVLAYITAKDRTEANRLASMLVKEKLAPCVNIIPSVHSHYIWKGRVEKSREAVLIVKTLVKNKKKLIAKVKSVHSYECPCILFLEVKGGNADYLKWLADSVR